MRRILVPLDGSTLAEEVLPHAKELATSVSGTIYLVRVVPLAHQLAGVGYASPAGMEVGPSLDPATMEKAIGAETEEARSYLRLQAGKLEVEGIRVQWQVRQGAAAEEIIRFSQENGIELIAISSHGRSGLGRLVFGSVSDRVIRESGVPVMVIKHSRGGRSP